MNTIVTTLICTVATVVAVGSWAVGSLQADARTFVPAALEQTDTLHLTVGTKNLPVQQFDAI